MNIEKKKKLIIIMILLMATAIVGVIVGILFNITKETSSNVAKHNETENQQVEPIVVPETTDEETDEPQETEENVPEEPEEEPKETDDIPYYIKVNNKANVVTIYKKDANGNYTIPYKAMICSIGKATPEAGNIYTIPGGTWDRWTWGQMVGGVWAQYYTRIKGSILFHSVPYTAKDKSTLEYWEYDKLGTKASAGCIRLTVEDAKWIYDNCKPGTKVEFYESSDPGPLGKPTTKIISNEAEYVRGWDPTDPDSRNPWKTYTPSQINQQGPTEENNQNSNTANSSNSNTSNNTNVEDNKNQTDTGTTEPGMDNDVEIEEPIQPEQPITPPEQDQEQDTSKNGEDGEDKKDETESTETPKEDEQEDTTIVEGEREIKEKIT